jgi:hypothetical protein
VEKQKSVDQRLRTVELFLAEHGERLTTQGTIVATFRQRDGRRLGPYYRLACRDSQQRQVSVYLGAAGPVVAATRERLEQLQQRHHQQRFWKNVRQGVHQKMKAAREQLAAELALRGLYHKGAEIRGWRQLG